MGRIFPSWDDLKNLRTPLTEGEYALARLLDDYLPERWRIYVQPYINDMRPDIVIVNPNIGVVVFEVKDWDISRYTFENNRLIGTTTTNRWIEEDPAHKADWYAKSLYQQFLVSDEAVVPSRYRAQQCDDMPRRDLLPRCFDRASQSSIWTTSGTCDQGRL